ncbi:carboxypeptidase regulatory-like domain-containing protein [Roseisolibacter sp. H3M3-2]|uniref:carboxypeptidase regulatory-like domain-containing protein n=1 Tax=Roseisolibacter sp. H3M3-2 TaxID=3031323 RepID=UPI0023DA6809|nr:carboxypeptidase regulatory-like domain-containing protein [Roseisolibacter sp. H3M3-2]MDF1506246.1 TonB-dependent receptor plug domain-containing protein [Roseisolibacter sp. H3M3-2]
MSRRLLPLLLLAAAPAAARAQATGTLAGVVAVAGADALSPAGLPVPTASVTIAGSQRVAPADSARRFAFAAVTPGTHRLVVRGVGFEPLEVTARVGGGDTTWLRVGLRPAAPQLAKVTVREAAGSGNAAFDARRAAGGRGRFIGPEELQRNQGRQVSEMLSTVPGVRLVPQPDGGVAVSSRRGQTSVNADTQCYLAVYVDGMRVFEPTVAEGTTVSPNGTVTVTGGSPPSVNKGAVGGRPPGQEPPNVNVTDLAQLGGIEVYAGPGSLPGELAGTGNACGAVLFWTRKR